MLKLTISASTLVAISVGIANVASQTKVMIASNSKLTALTAKKEALRAKMLGMTDEEYTEFKTKYTSKNNALDKLPLLINIKPKSTKIFTVSTDNDELSLTINEDFIKDVIEVTCKGLLAFVPNVIDFLLIQDKVESELDAFEAKWREVKEQEEETDPTIPETKTENTDTWTCKLDNHPSKPIPLFKDESMEEFVLLEDLVWTRGETPFNIDPLTTKSILTYDKTKNEIARLVGLPVSLIECIFAHYNQELPKEDTTTTE